MNVDTQWVTTISDRVRSSNTIMALAAGGIALAVVLLVGPFIGSPSFFFYFMFWMSLALALNILFGFTGYVPFGYFGFYGVGSYAAAMGFIHLDIPMLAAIPFSLLAGVALAVIFLPMLRLDGIYFAIANFAAAYAIRIGVGLTPDELTGGASGLELAQAYSPAVTYYAMFGVTVAVVITTLWLRHSRTGLLLRAIREDDIAAETCGINKGRLRSIAWLLSAGFGGIIGGLDAWNTAVVDPNSAFDVMISVKPFLYTIFGGTGTVIGPVLGSGSLYLIDNWIWKLVPTGSYLLTGFVLMLVVLLFPRGLVREVQDRDLLDLSFSMSSRETSLETEVVDE